MSPDRIKISVEFHINGMGLWLSAESPIAQGEDITTEFKKAKSLLDDAYKELSSDYSGVNGHPMGVTQVERSQMSMEDAINSCTDMGVLVTYKLLVKGKPHLQEVYDKKVADLSK